MKIIAIIPARGGSKSIKLKNIAKLNGKPLLSYTSEAAKKSNFISEIFLSTDNKTIANLAKKEGLSFLGYRPKNLSKDNTKTIDVVINLLKKIEKVRNYKPDIIVLLQPTSPLRSNKDIDNAIKLFIKSNATSLVSTVNLPHNFNPESIMRLKNNKLYGLKKSLKNHVTIRQQKEKYLARNGAAIYISSYDSILKNKSFYGEKTIPYFMSKINSIDIDDQEDLIIAESIIKNQNF